MTNFHGKFVPLHKICARTGCTSAKSKLSALGLHRPCYTHFERDADLFVAQSLYRTCTSNEIFYEQNQYYIEAVPYGVDFNHSSIGAVQGPVESMGRGLRFLYAHTDSASPYQTLRKEL